MAVQSTYSIVQIDSSNKKGKEAVYYDDIQTNISNVRIPPANAPTWRDYAFGIGGGVTFPVLGFAVGDYIYFDIQTPHAMQLNSILEEHFHFTTPTNGTGSRFQFQLDVISAPVNGQWSVPTGSPFISEEIMSGDDSTYHRLHESGSIPAVNTSVSTLYKCQLTRIAATQDEYAGEVYINFIDGHYLRDRDGSEQEYTKED